VTDLAGGLVTSSRPPGRLQKWPDDRTWNAERGCVTTGQVVHTQLPRRWHSSLIYRVVKLGTSTFTMECWCRGKNSWYQPADRRRAVSEVWTHACGVLCCIRWLTVYRMSHHFRKERNHMPVFILNSHRSRPTWKKLYEKMLEIFTVFPKKTMEEGIEVRILLC